MYKQILKGAKSILGFKLTNKDKKELAEIQNNLICRLSSATDEVAKNMIKSIKEIDRVLN